MATLKTFDPPLSALEGRRFAGARRRGKHLLFTDDGELVLHPPDERGPRPLPRARAKGPKTPAFRLRLEDGGELILTEGGEEAREGRSSDRRRSRPSSNTSGPRRRPSRRTSSARSPGARGAGCIRSSATSGRSPDRAGLVERDPQPGEALAVRADHRSVRRGDRAPRRDDPRADGLRPRLRLSQGPVTRRRTRCTTGSASRAQLRHPDRTGRLRGAHDLLLPRLPDRRAGPRDRRLSRLLR